MSYGAGTGAVPSAFNLGTAGAARSNGKQHSLPENPHHHKIDPEDIVAHWDINTKKGPTRLWGETKSTKYGGLERHESCGHQWLQGEYWNVDSNIRKWGLHEVKRNAAAANHDVHRHDQYERFVLPPKPGSDKPPRQCVSGVVSPDSCFLEAWGFDLGLRDRQGNNTTLWKPVRSGEMFRSDRSFNRHLPRMVENYRALRKTASMPGTILADTLRPEDVGGEAGELATRDDTNWQDNRAGRTHGSRSCYGWDNYDHTARREAAKMSCGTHCPSMKEHNQGHPFKEELELNPASIYTKKFRVNGEDSLRRHMGKSTRVPAGFGTMR